MHCNRSLPKMSSALKRCLVQACILSQPLVQALPPEKFDYRYYGITMKVSRDYIGNLIQHRKTQSLYEKRLFGPKRAVFNFFQTSTGGGGLTPETPPCVRHCSAYPDFINTRPN